MVTHRYQIWCQNGVGSLATGATIPALVTALRPLAKLITPNTTQGRSWNVWDEHRQHYVGTITYEPHTGRCTFKG